MSAASIRARLRILRFLGGERAVIEDCAHRHRVRLAGASTGAISVERAAFDDMLRAGIVELSDGSAGLTAEGRAALKRVANASDPFRGQHQEQGDETVMVDGTARKVRRNRAESPLSLLARRRNADGGRFLSLAQLRAGERLRRDFAGGMMMPRMGADLSGSASIGRRGGARASVELTDAALAARQRVEAAAVAVGPELAGILLDVCCFLKGLETIEMERQWPPRSAKIVLRTALAALARHYGEEAEPGRGRDVLHWGAADYRPRIRGQTAG